MGDMGSNYKDYVKKGMKEKFVEVCKKNCLDFYSCGCILTAHLAMKRLMAHTYKGVWKEEKCTPKEAWDDANSSTGNFHSGASAGMTASIIAHFSPRGDEFKKWWNKGNI